MSNKEKAIDFLQLVTSGKVQEAYDSYVEAGFVHHNPYFAGDAESLKIAMQEDAEANFDKIFDIQRSAEEKNLVFVHSKIQMNSDVYAVVHIFRFGQEGIIELWDVVQHAPENSPNELGMF